MISYAGVPLPLVTPELQAYLQSYLDADSIQWFGPLDSGTAELVCTTRVRERTAPQIHLSRLIWPTDLSRFATALFVCTTQQLHQILAAVDAGKPRIMANLKIGANISVPMLLLSPVQVAGRPVNPETLAGSVQQPAPAPNQYEGLWLLPLVDDRYYGVNGVQYTELTQTEWKPWLEAAQNLCGIACTVANVSSEYMRPGQVYFPQGNTPGLTMLMDSAAVTIGRRYVRQLNGAYELQTYQDALAKSLATSSYPVIAGSRHHATPIVLPFSFTFRWHDSGSTTIDISTIAEAQWPPNAHWRGARTITMRCSRPIGQEAAGESFARAWAVQHTAWHFVRHDIAYAGAVPYVLTGGDDRVEITCDSTVCMTRVYARHSEWIDSLSVIFPGQTIGSCDGCGKSGGGDCSPVTSVQCTGGMLVVTYGECP